MALTGAIVATEFGNRLKDVYVNVTAAGSYTTGGMTFDLTALTNPNYLPDPFMARVPAVYGIMNEEMSGYYAGIVAGTALNNWKIKYYNPGGTEVSAGALPSQITSGALQLVFSVAGGAN